MTLAIEIIGWPGRGRPRGGKNSKPSGLLLRDALICERFAAGATQPALAADFGITYQRVQQILWRNGIRYANARKAENNRIKREDAQAKRDAAYVRRHGMTREERREIVAEHGHAPINTYVIWRANRRVTGFEGRLLFGEWWHIVGHRWPEYGRGGRGLGIVRTTWDRPFGPDNCKLAVLGEHASATRHHYNRERIAT